MRAHVLFNDVAITSPSPIADSSKRQSSSQYLPVPSLLTFGRESTAETMHDNSNGPFARHVVVTAWAGNVTTKMIQKAHQNRFTVSPEGTKTGSKTQNCLYWGCPIGAMWLSRLGAAT